LYFKKIQIDFGHESRQIKFRILPEDVAIGQLFTGFSILGSDLYYLAAKVRFEARNPQDFSELRPLSLLVYQGCV